MAEYHLIGAEISPYSQRVVRQLEHKGIAYTFEHPPGGFTSDEFGVINPIRKLPVLITKDFRLPESQIICEYIEQCHPEPSLLPEEALDLAKCRMVIRIVDLYIMNQMLPLFQNMSRKTRKPDVVDHCLGIVKTGLVGLNTWLAPEVYAVGGKLSLADIATGPVLFYLQKYLPFFGLEDPFEGFPNLKAYWEQCAADPVVNTAITEIREGLESRFG